MSSIPRVPRDDARGATRPGDVIPPGGLGATGSPGEGAAVDGLREAKRAARAAVRRGRAHRAALAPDALERRQEAEAVAAAVLARMPLLPPSPPVPDALISAASGRRTVASYVALATEPSTAALHEELLARGLRVIVPVLLPDKDLDWVELGRAEAEPGEPATLGRQAIGSAAVVIVPALQIGHDGGRLGQGGGSYDRALARRAPGALVVAVVDDDGLVEAVPREPHDAAVSAVVRPGHGWVDLPLGARVCENTDAPDGSARAAAAPTGGPEPAHRSVAPRPEPAERE